MTKDQPLAELSYADLLQRISEPDIWSEFLSRYFVRLEEFRSWYERNRIRGGAVTFDDILQKLLEPTEKRPIGYLQKALIAERPPTEQDFLRLAKHKFRQRLIDEARREARRQLVTASEFAGDVPAEQPPGMASMEIWRIIRDAVGTLDETERVAIRLYYGLPETDDGEGPNDIVIVQKIAHMIDEMEKRGIELTYEQAKEKLKKARRLLGVVLMPYREALNND